MARRANTKIKLPWILGIIALILIAGGGGFYFWNQVDDPFRTTAQLDLASYVDNANNLRGNTYKFEGTIENALAWHPKFGRLFSVRVKKAGGDEYLGIRIPENLEQVDVHNIQKGQNYYFMVNVVEDGILVVTQIKKV